MKVVFVRHGESEANVADFINDDPKRIVNLTQLGREQAEEAAERLRSIPFNHAFVSEFPRARQTAEIILQHHPCELWVDARLNERKSGMDGLPTCTFNDLVMPDPIQIRPPHGENFLEQTVRLRSFLESLESFTADAWVLAVSHEYPLRSPIVARSSSSSTLAAGHLCRTLRNSTLPASARVMAFAIMIGQLSNTIP